MALEAKEVTKQFLRRRSGSNVFNAVDHVSITLENKKIAVITGPSGSGKSTLLSMMAGILAPTEGSISVGGKDLYSMDDAELSAFRGEHIGVIPQGQTAVHSLNTLDNVLLPWTLAGGRKNSAEEIRKRAEDLLERTGIRDLEDTMPSEMSGGELRRAAVVRAMLLKPDVILADEPTADLDEENTKAVLSLMRCAADEGSAVLIVTHDKDVFPFADQVYTLKEGKLQR